jgi:short chain dehydrogenase
LVFGFCSLVFGLWFWSLVFGFWFWSLVFGGMVMTQGNIIKILVVAGAAVLARSVFRTRNAYSFEGKSVLITGGSRGLGLVLARQFAREGARVTICARDEQELARAREDLLKLSAEVFTVQCDVVISIQAKLAVLFHGIFPGFTADILGMVNELLPAPGGIGALKAKGKESMSAWSPSWLTLLNERAAVANNEIN